MSAYLPLSIIVPLLTGIALLILKPKNYIALAFAAIITLLCALSSSGTLLIASFTENIQLVLFKDTLSAFMSILIAAVFLLCTVFAFEYTKHDEDRSKFFGFSFLTLASLMGLCFANNMFTFYLFYEMMTLCSFPLVLHTKTDASRRAAFKYLGFSVFGAGLVLFGMILLGEGAFSPFTNGGIASIDKNNTPACLLMVLGFSCKAGMFPLSQWLPTAHPQAPAPASACLSGLITKAGIFGIIRTVFCVFGADAVRGTYVQYTVIVLALFTVFMGSMLAYKEKIFKKRLAYSSVSQLSYVIFALMLLNVEGFCGALLQILFHAAAKAGLFLCAGAVIHKTGIERTDELYGIGKKMPVVMTCFTALSLSLIGIPPFGGFASKWQIMQGASQMGTVGIIGMAVLLISALLTAFYLLPITHDAFFAGKAPKAEKLESSLFMTLPLVILAAFVLIGGIFSGEFLALANTVAGGLF